MKKAAAAIAGATILWFCTACACAGSAGSVFPDADFLNNFAPLWLAAGLSGAAVATLVRPRMWFTYLGGVALTTFSIATIAPEYMHRPIDAAPLPGMPALRVVQFNILKSNPSPERAAAWIAATRPDIVILEEANRNPDGVVARLTPIFPYQQSCLAAMRCSTVILSRQPPIASGGLAHGDPENRKAVSAAWARFADKAGTFTVLAVHFQHPWPFGTQAEAQATVARLLEGIDRNRAIIAGDFNLTPWTFAMKRQDRNFGIPRITRAIPTWPDPLPILPIDHVYAGLGWRLISMARGPASGSDHYPLAFTLAPARY